MLRLTVAPLAPLLMAALAALAHAAPPSGLDLPTVVDPHPPAINTATCDFHGTSSPYSAKYGDLETSLVGPRGNIRNLQAQVETHQVGGASVVVIEDGAITQHHWYGCRDRKRASRTTVNTLYQAASLSKFVAAIGMVHADRHGDLDLDHDVARLANDFPDSLLNEWTRDNFRGDEDDYLEDITVRRLLNHTAGLDTHGIGAWSPVNVPTMREIILGSNDFGSYYVGGVEPINAPGTVYEYSGGGFIVAEHILELHSPLSFKDYLKDHVLDSAGLTLSTFDKATTSMSNLVRGCSRSACTYDLLQTNVKAAGGLLANAREYAAIVTSLVNGGLTDDGGFVMSQADLDQILRPAASPLSTFDACSTPGATRTLYMTVVNNRVPIGLETCVAGTWRMPLMDGSGWYGLGVGLSTTVLSDGFPRVVSHGGAQDGSRTYFEIDRQTGDGIVIMVNGVESWVDGDGFTFGGDVLLDEIHDAWHDAY